MLPFCVLIGRARRGHGWKVILMPATWVSCVFFWISCTFSGCWLFYFFSYLCLFDGPPIFYPPPSFPNFAHSYLHSLNTNFFSVSLVLTTEEIQAIDDAGAKGPPRSCMLNFSGWTARTLVNRAASLALLAGAAVLGMRLYFGVGG